MAKDAMAQSDNGSQIGSESGAGREGQGPVKQDDNMEEGDMWMTGLFGVGFTVMKEKSPGWVWASFRLFFDIYQLFLLVVQPQYGFTGWVDADNRGWQVFSWIGLNQFMIQRGYTFYSVCLYGISATLIANIALCFWVGASFRSANFNMVWPVVWLRWFGRIFYQVLDVATLSLLLIALDCQYYARPPSMIHFNQEFPDKNCFEGGHLGMVFLAIISLTLFALSATFFSLAEVELDPLAKNPLAMAHSMVETYGFLLKMVMTVSATLLYDPRHAAVSYVSCSLLLMVLYIQWIPHQNDITNIVRCASYTLLFYCSLVLLIMSVREAEIQNYAEVPAWRESCTIALWCGLLPSAALGALMAYLRLSWVKNVVKRISQAEQDGNKLSNIVCFNDARQVEILGRCCRQFDSENPSRPLPAAVALAEVIIKEGMSQLPSDALMVVQFSSFLIDVLGSYQSGYSLLQQARKRNPSFLERYAIFSREQMHAQKASSMQSGTESSDLVSYVEYQRSYKMARQAHKDALVAIRTFWTILLQSKVKFETLTDACDKLGAAIKAAEQTYRVVLSRHAMSLDIVRVKQDPWGAVRWQQEADQLAQAEEQIKSSNQYAELDGLDPGLRDVLSGLSAANDPRAVLLANAQGMITLANQTAHDLLGYAPGQLKAKPLHILMPSPFSDHHQSHVRTHLTTGRQVVLKSINEVVAMHRERYLMAMSLQVVKVSGIGEDTIFLGTLLPQPQPPNTARLWCDADGLLIGSCAHFLDWSGFRPDELQGKALASLLAETSAAQALEALLKSSTRADAPAADSRRLTNITSSSANRHATLISAGAAALLPIAEIDAVGKATNEHRAVSSNGKATNEHQTVAFSGGKAQASENSGQALAPAALNKLVQIPRPASHAALTHQGTLVLRHKYLGTVCVSVALQNNAIGSHTFKMLTLTRVPDLVAPSLGAPTPGSTRGRLGPKLAIMPGIVPAAGKQAAPAVSLAESLMVLDKKGRLCHISKSLAEALGSNAKDLVEASGYQGSVTALDLLLPPPFAQLHRAFTADMPLHMPPPYSCRSGLAILMSATNPAQGSIPTPFRMTMAKREQVDPAVGDVYVVQMAKVSLDTALSERRLHLLVDVTTGNVVQAGRSSKSLFGFAPKGLEGQPLSQAVKLLQDEGGKPSKAMMALLAARAHSQGESSYRVGVTKPQSKVDTLLQGVAIAPANMPVPAIMVVRVARPAAKPTKADLFFQAGDTKVVPSRPHVEMEVLKKTTENGSVAVITPLENSAVIDQEETLVISCDIRRPAGRESKTLDWSALQDYEGEDDEDWEEEEVEDDPPLFLEIELWRSDLASSVLAVDSVGMVVPTHDSLPLYPSGLMFGQPATSIVGVLVSQFLPQLAGSSVSALLEPTGLPGLLPLASSPQGPISIAAQAQAGRRGGMKSVGGLQAGDLGRAKVGPMLQIRGRCMGDGLEVELSVQAVQRQGGGCWLLLHPFQPTTGRPDLRRWLEAEHHLQLQEHMPQPLERMPSLMRTGLDITPNFTRGSAGSGYHAPALIQLEGLSALARGSMTVSHHGGGPDPGRGGPDLGYPDRLDAGVEDDGGRKGVRFNGDGHSGPSSPVRSKALGLTKVGVLPAPPSKSVPKDRLIRQWLGSAEDDVGPLDGMHAAPAMLMDDDHPGSGAGPYDDEDEREEDQEGGQGGSQAEAEMVGGQSKVRPAHEGLAQDLDEADNMQVKDSSYKRGRRVKKLMHMMARSKLQDEATRFRWHIPILVLAVIAIHTVAVIFIKGQLDEQSQGITALVAAGAALQWGHESMTAALLLQITYRNAAYLANPTDLADLQNTTENIQKQIDYLEYCISNMRLQHQEVYLKGSQYIINSKVLSTLWQTPVVQYLIFTEAPPTPAQLAANPPDLWYTAQYAENVLVQLANGSTSLITQTEGYTSLWALGNMLTEKGDLLWRTAPAVSKVRDLASTIPYLYLNEMFDGYHQGYMATSSAMVSVVVAKTDTVQTAQKLMLGLEGLILTCFVSVWVWVVSARVGLQRFFLFKVFVVVPVGPVRTLAKRQFDLGDDEDGDDDGQANAGGEAEAPVAVQAIITAPPHATSPAHHAAPRRSASMQWGPTGDQANKADISTHNNKGDASYHNNNNYNLMRGTSGSVNYGREGSAQYPPTSKTDGGYYNVNVKPGEGSYHAATNSYHAAASGMEAWQQVVPVGRQGSVTRMGTMTRGIPPTRHARETSPVSLMKRVWGKVQAFLALNPDQVLVGKRQLLPSLRTPLLMILPFILWGVMIIAINALGLAKVSGVSLPIALFNVVNRVRNIGTIHTFHQYLMAQAQDQVESNRYKEELVDFNDQLKTNLEIMLFGGTVKDQDEKVLGGGGVFGETLHWSFSNETATSVEVGQGVASEGSQGVSLLYTAQKCMRANQSTCFNSSSVFYGDVMNGLMRLVEKSVEQAEKAITLFDSMYPGLDSVEMAWTHNTRPDMRDGLATLVQDYQQYALQVYQTVLVVHIVGLALTVVIFALYLMFLWWPYTKQLASETKVVAELLSQLPPETDVEGIMQKLLGGAKTSQT